MAIQKDKPSKDWLKTQLVNPQAHNPTSIMPSFASRLNDDQMNAMIEFLNSLSTRKATPLAPGEKAEESSTALSTASVLLEAAYNLLVYRRQGTWGHIVSSIMHHVPWASW